MLTEFIRIAGYLQYRLARLPVGRLARATGPTIYAHPVRIDLWPYAAGL